ncbi:hypothetical protein G159_16295 [Planococcus glaciei CHR43]|uniref:lipopolysaccharide biosynthesis protein n=1 Tax=Planococcus glaciei TaxID=459472 RepID=UPI0003DF0C36|nr:lipopolysaccharide biosynthesis protein [Planococcus glaciei]ETP67659.1 hypothetical protein G159_16295 [Planococcus glaciei CHR43]
MTVQITKSKILSSLVWKFLEIAGSQGILLVIQIILARLLMPEDFGLIALVSVFIVVASVMVQSGLNTALIQKKDADATDISSVFYISLIVAAVLYLIVFFCAPVIAIYYKEPQLTLILRVLMITLFASAFNSIQNVIVAKNMLFKKQFFSSVAAILFSGVLGITLAYNGFGVWALVIQQLTNRFSLTIILFVTVKWRPQLLFSLKKVKLLYSYGWKLLVSALIDTLYMNIYSLIVGKTFGTTTLGFFNRGEQFPKLFATNINGSIQAVMFPVLASQQDNHQRVKEMMRRSIVTSSFIVFPLMTGLAIVAEPLIKILLTERWLPAVPFLQYFCLLYSLLPIQTANLQAIIALGRSDIFLKLEIIKKVVSIIILIFTVPHGVYAIVIGLCISGIFSTLINIYPNLKLLNYSYIEQFKDIIPSMLISVTMGILIYYIKWIEMSEIVTMFCQIFIGIILYIGIAKTFKVESYTYLLATLKSMLQKTEKTH